jgi:hypothetical protein
MPFRSGAEIPATAGVLSPAGLSPEPVRDGVCTGVRIALRSAGGAGATGVAAEAIQPPAAGSGPPNPGVHSEAPARVEAHMDQPPPRRAQPDYRRRPGLRQIPAMRRSDEDERRAPSGAARADD